MLPQTGKKPDRPYAGKFLVRVTPETHRALERLAHLRESTVSEVASDALNMYVRAGNPGIRQNSPAEPAGPASYFSEGQGLVTARRRDRDAGPKAPRHRPGGAARCPELYVAAMVRLRGLDAPYLF